MFKENRGENGKQQNSNSSSEGIDIYAHQHNWEKKVI